MGIGMRELMIVMFSGVFAFIYLLPGFIAVYRRHPNFIPIVLLNVLLGWSIVGWVGALIWALLAKRELKAAN